MVSISDDTPDRLCPSFSGDAATKWHRIRKQYEDENGDRPTDSEILVEVLDRLDDPWKVALEHYDSFTDQAFKADGVGPREYDFLQWFRSFLLQLKNGDADPEEARERLEELLPRPPGGSGPVSDRDQETIR